MNHHGELIEDETQLKHLGVSHFFDLFTHDGATNIEDQLKVISLFPSFVLDEEKVSFMADPTLFEIEGILKGFKKDKTGLDGWLVKFYLHFFNLVGIDILRVVAQSMSKGRVLGDLNSTFIKFIPKCDNPTSFANFRPISLCKLAYKIISKLAAIRLKLYWTEPYRGISLGSFLIGKSLSLLE